MLLELALVVPLVTTLLLGVIEFGSAWKDANTLDRAVLGAGRTGSSVADGRPADLATLESLVAGLGAASRASIEKVVIYQSTRTDGSVPPECLSASTTGNGPHGVPGVCNVYTGDQVTAMSEGRFAGTTSCAPSAWDAMWCPTSRIRDVEPQKVGVWVQVHYEPLTGLLPTGGSTLARSAVYQLEPSIAGS